MKATVAAILLGAFTAIAFGVPLSRGVRDDVSARCGIVESDSNRHRRVASVNQNRLWPNAVVPFVLADQFEASDMRREIIFESMRHWEEKTCIRFKRRTHERDYVEITDNMQSSNCECCSMVGKVGGRQVLTLATWQCFAFSTIVHELGHVIGFFHEVSRPDRDEYITVHTENIRPQWLHAFHKMDAKDVRDLGVPYDYHSVMHYEKYTFTKNNRPTIEVKSGFSIYNGELSPCDAKEARLLYSCPNPADDPPKMIPPKVVLPPSFPSNSSSDCQFRLKYNGSISSALNFRGTFTSVNFPGHYPDNKECAWIIEGPPGFKTYMMFEGVSLDSGDTITVKTLLETKTLTSSSHSRASMPLNHHEVSIVLRANNVGGSGKGFKATYRFSDINECALFGRYRCPNGCVNYPGGFRCRCAEGMYIPEKNPYVCIDINECCVDNGGCSHQCTNTYQSYKCACPDDMVLGADGKNCTRPAECMKCAHGCTMKSGKAVCQCPEGQTLASDGVTCVDKDECATGEHGCQQICLNLPGSYMCQCDNGYQLGADGRTCEDYNECLVANYHGCSHGCVNTEGSYQCTCPEGFVMKSDGRTCEDINECDGSHGCEHRCINTQGSFKCACLQDGYRLGPDGTSCKEIDECAEGIHNCDQICQNTDGSFTCSCRQGYQLARDGTTCLDIDECLQGTSRCSHDCVNTWGSYRCTCPRGYELSSDGRTCTDVNECSSNSHGCSDICVNTPGSYRCSCPTGYRLSQDGRICSDIDECRESDSCPMGVCHNTKGSFTCSCPFGWQQGPDGACRPGGEMTVKGSLDIPLMDSVKDAEWSVVAEEGKVVCVDLSALGLRPTADGRNYVEVRNGRHNNSIILARFSGTGLAKFTTDVPDVYIVLHSQDPLDRNASIHVTDDTWTEFSLRSGGKYLQPGKVEMLGSSQFPVPFNLPNSAYYFLVGKPGYRIVVEFIYIDLPDGQQDCSRNYVGVRDGLRRGPMLAHLCGPTDRVQYSTNGMVMRVNMASAPTQNTRGFLAKAWIEQP